MIARFNGKHLEAVSHIRPKTAIDSPKPVTLDSDLTTELATFNAEKYKPLALGGKIVETPTEADFSATITDWTPGNGEDGENGSAGMETNN